jgi:hypothetical protein
MITAGHFKKGVVTMEGSHWLVEGCYIQQSAKRHLSRSATM